MERITDISQVFEEIQMIFVNIQDYADLREEMQETVRIFTGFCDKIFRIPTRMLPPIAFKMPPTEMVGSISPASKMCDSIEVVVVLPWVPEIAIGTS